MERAHTHTHTHTHTRTTTTTKRSLGRQFKTRNLKTWTEGRKPEVVSLTESLPDVISAENTLKLLKCQTEQHSARGPRLSPSFLRAWGIQYVGVTACCYETVLALGVACTLRTTWASDYCQDQVILTRCGGCKTCWTLYPIRINTLFADRYTRNF